MRGDKRRPTGAEELSGGLGRPRLSRLRQAAHLLCFSTLSDKWWGVGSGGEGVKDCHRSTLPLISLLHAYSRVSDWPCCVKGESDDLHMSQPPVLPQPPVFTGQISVSVR